MVKNRHLQNNAYSHQQKFTFKPAAAATTTSSSSTTTTTTTTTTPGPPPPSSPTGGKSQTSGKPFHFEPISLFSQDDKSLRDVIDMVTNCSVNRQRFCVVSIVSKDALNESMKDHIAQTILSPDWRKHRSHQRDSPRSEEATSDTRDSNEMQDELSSMLSTCCSLHHQTEAQVDCHVNLELGIIVLNMCSFMEASYFHKLEETYKKSIEFMDDPSNVRDPIDHILDTPLHLKTLAGSNIWPSWHQTLVKTLLVLFAMSHMVVFYNPEPSLDHSLVKLLKILDLFRMRSESRIVDLLESIASKQAFSQLWIRQARVACPRALFVFDTANMGYRFNRKQLTSLKSELEDQIYSILKRTNLLLTSQSERHLVHFASNGGLVNSGSVNVGLLSLPHNNDFVFLIERDLLRKKSSQTAHVKKPATSDGDDSLRPLDRPNHDCALGSNNLSQLLCMNEVAAAAKAVYTQTEHNQDDVDNNTTNGGTIFFQRSLKRFMKQHIGEYQGQYRHQDSKAKQAHSVLLPRCDDFFIVLLGLKCLLFPASAVNRLGPDDRKFVNIYDHFNEDHLFSRRHCLKTRQAAFEYLANRLDGFNQPLASPKTRLELLNIYNETLATVRRLYLNHARGPALSQNLVRLDELCSRYWDALMAKRDLNGVDKSCATVCRQNPTQGTKSSLSNWNSTTIPITIERRLNGIRVMSSCDNCGHDNALMIQSADKKKKLERIHVTKGKKP